MKTKRKPTQAAISAVMALSCGLSTLGFLPMNVLAASGEVDITLLTFPDASFREYVSNNYDKNKDKVLSVSELDAVKELRITGDGSKFVNFEGIEYFDSIETITLDNVAIDSGNYFDDNDSLKSLTIKNCKNFDYISQIPDTLETLDLTGDTGLTGVNISESNLKTLILKDCKNLDELLVPDNKLTSIDITNCVLLKQMMVEENNILSVDISTCPLLVSKFNELPTKAVLVPPTENLCENDIIVYSEGLADGFDENNTLMVFDPATKIVNGSDYFLYGKGIVSTAPATPVTPTTPTTPVVTPTTEAGLPGFIERLYNVALGRQSEEAGKNWWINKVKQENYTGADVANGFLVSDEFLGKQMSNDQFLEVLYKTFFDRSSDAAGKSYWLDQMNSGYSKKDVINGFCNSTEWANLCLTYGIPSGSSAAPTIVIEPNEGTKAFVSRLYTTCLGRVPEAEGFEYWTYRLANMQERGYSAAYGFFTSPEFVSKGYNNSAYISLLYATILGRVPDQAGLNYWLGLMNNGMSRNDVLKGFADSNEWADICASYGILK